MSDSSSVVVQGSLVDTVVDALGNDPVFVGLVVAMLLFVFFAYLFVRRTVTGLQQGYQEGRRR
ncbi:MULTISPECIES: DUF7859 family protein [Haloprofundus]|uniref:DUF7859 family protein n=1 Tax=Haloprofundus TaxID=1911573 RepID=UPI000E4350AC|nr:MULTISPECIES: hypothetical protein [Haloprofundus]QCJ46996.1 hypothetical protein FCF25_07675 [Haloprofundus sp. MHR1]